MKFSSYPFTNANSIGRVMSGIITAPAFNNLFTATKDNPTMQGAVTAIYEIGCLLGAIFILIVGDMLGRRKAMILGGLVMILGVIIQVTAMEQSTPLAQFIVGRVITGVGNGINTSTIPTYQGKQYPRKEYPCNSCKKPETEANHVLFSRMQQNLESWALDLYRGWSHCLWHPCRLLD